jgi:hypothetical protein
LLHPPLTHCRGLCPAGDSVTIPGPSAVHCIRCSSS